MSRRYDIDHVGNVAFQCLWCALVVTAILGCIFILSVGLSGCIEATI
jgi:hypothetical protein